MKAIIQKRKILNEVFSASGIEYLNGLLYIIGDDSPFLYLFTVNGEFIKKVLLFQPKGKLEERIPKKEKIDLETLASITYKGVKYLVTLGSGSKKEKRDKGFLINAEDLQVSELNLKPFYDDLRRIEEVVGEAKLNVEGLCASLTQVILLTRGNVSGKNISLAYDLNNFFDYLLSGAKLITPIIAAYGLPSVSGWLSGFSGAAYLEKNDSIIYTSTVEKTTNEIDDGETLGSFIGTISLNDPTASVVTCQILDGEKPYLGKVESIAVLNHNKTISCVAVTDNDGGDSELLWIEVSI